MAGGPRVQWGRWVFYAAVALLAAWMLWSARAIWFPVGMAFLIAIVLDPTVDRLENRGVPRGVATGLVFLTFVASAILAVIVFSPGISAQASAIAADLGRLFPDPEKPSLVPVTAEILARLDAHPALRDALLNAARDGTLHLRRALEGTSGLVLAWAPNLIWFLVVPVLAAYILNDFHRIYAKLILLAPPRHRPFTQTLIAEISALFGRYLRGVSLLCLLLGLCIAAVLYAFGNPYWQLLGFLGGILYAVPVVGPLFTVCLVVLVTLVGPTPGKAVWAGGAVLLLTSGLFDQVITPRIVGRQVGLHPILTILALMLGYQLWGIGGMLVAVPVAASIQTVVVHLVPKLGANLELRPLEELKVTEAETRAAHLEAEADLAADDHYCLNAVVENVESPADDPASSDRVAGAPDDGAEVGKVLAGLRD